MIYLKSIRGLTYLDSHGVQLLEDVAEVCFGGLVAPHGQVVEVQDGRPVLQQAVQDADLCRAHLCLQEQFIS